MLDQSPTRRLSTGATAKDLAEVAARYATESEERRRLHPDVVKAMLSAGFARHFVPASRGGDPGTFEELTSAIATVGEACTATAWCAGIAAHTGRLVAFLPEEGHAEVWADGPDAFVVGGFTPGGKAEPAPGGWRLSGVWPYASGVDFSDWALVCGVVPSPGGGPAMRMFALPRSDYDIKDTWFSGGMRATGSNTIVVQDVFVPDARTFDRQHLFTGAALGSSDGCHQVPLHATNGLNFTVPALGAARGALAIWSEGIAAKLRRSAGKPAGPGPGRATYEVVLARSAGEIDAAQLLLERASSVADRGAAITPLEAVRNFRDSSVAADLLATAVNRLFANAGTSGQAIDSPVQRIWRDVNSVVTHVALAFETCAAPYAAHVFKV